MEGNRGGAPRWRRMPEGRRGAILHAGLAEFDANGLEGARMDVIAEAAGLSKGTIYRYFPDKQGLFRAAVLGAISDALDNFHLSALADPELRVRRIWSLAHDPKFTAAYRLSLIQARSTDVAAAASQIIEDRLAKPLADYLRQTGDSIPAPGEALVLSRLVVATILGSAVASIATPESLSARVAFLLRACGLAAQSPQADGF